MNKFSNIDIAIKWVINRQNYQIGLDKFKSICNQHHLKNNFKIIHVAGTNGKGSVVNFIKDVLMEEGYIVGTFTSPHLINYQDRIRVNNENIDDESFLKYMNKYFDVFNNEKMNMFEISTFIMCLYFNDKKVDFGVIETGIGGRKDSSNVFNESLLSIITTIGFDHMDRLGNTIKEIAYEKAGIIKNKNRVLTGFLCDEAKTIIKKQCLQANSEFYEVLPYISISDKKFFYKGYDFELFDAVCYQKDNAVLAIEACLLLNLKVENIKKGIKKSKWLARYEVIKENPKIIIDGAHNEDGVKALIKSYLNEKRPVGIVFSALKDKEVLKMINLLNKHSDFMILTEFDFYRVMKVDDINVSLPKEKDFKKAIDIARKEVEKGTLIICGSLYFISEVRKYLLNENILS